MKDEDRKLIQTYVDTMSYGDHSELASYLIDMASDVEPKEFVPMLPEKAIEQMRLQSMNPPPTLDHMLFVGISGVPTAKSVKGLTEEEIQSKIDSSKAKAKESAFNAIWNVHNYFKNT